MTGKTCSGPSQVRERASCDQLGLTFSKNTHTVLTSVCDSSATGDLLWLLKEQQRIFHPLLLFAVPQGRKRFISMILQEMKNN